MFVIFGLQFEDRLEGASNFIPWKDRVMLLLEEFELWDITKEVVMIPTHLDPLDEYNKKNVKEKHILLHAVKYHNMPHATSKNNSFDMWVALMKLYYNNNQNQKIDLREKLRDTKMTKNDNVTSYLIRI